MVRKMIVSIAVSAVALGAGSVLAQPGPNGSNNFGLCTAYFAGSDQGRANKRQAPPFAELERVASEAYEGDEEDPIEVKVADWCGTNAPHPSSNGQRGSNGGSPNGTGGGAASANGARGR